MTLVPRGFTRRLVTSLVACLLTSLALVVVGPTTPAGAADNGAWSVTPTPPDAETPTPRNYFVLEGAPGATVKDKVRIQNFTRKPIDFKIYGADGYNTAKGGFFALKALDQPQVDVGSWVRIPVQKVRVAGLTQVDVPVSIEIPDNATPGDHVGGIVALNAAIEGKQDAGAFDVGVQRAVGARLYLRVAGPASPGVEVDDIRLEHDRGVMPWSGRGRGTVTYTVENTGNLRLAPETTIELKGLFGRTLDTVDSAVLTDLLPGQRATITEKVEGIGPLDRVSTTVAVSTTLGVDDEASTVSWLIPWPLLVVLAVLIGLACWWWWRRRTAQLRALEAAESAPRIDVPVGP